ncbi:MAG: TolC family protein, partial [Ottowia sp.]|nr:TolC family protein [Ottowia sp.]
ALVALQGDRRRVDSLQSAAAAAARADTLARQQYQAGLIDFRTVLETQRTLLSAQDSAAGVRASLAADHVALYKALGGGWTPEPPTAEAQSATPSDTVSPSPAQTAR